MTRIHLLTALTAASLLVAVPRSAPAQSARPPLKPGHSAGVHAAQQTHTGLALIGTAAIIAVIVVAATTSNGGGNNNQPAPPSAPTTTAP